jgi:hypothetical protein
VYFKWTEESEAYLLQAVADGLTWPRISDRLKARFGNEGASPNAQSCCMKYFRLRGGFTYAQRPVGVKTDSFSNALAALEKLAAEPPKAQPEAKPVVQRVVYLPPRVPKVTAPKKDSAPFRTGATLGPDPFREQKLAQIARQSKGKL